VKCLDEDAGHIGGVSVAAGSGDFGDIESAVNEQILDTLQTPGVQEIGETIAGVGMEETGQIVRGALSLAGQRLYAQGGIVQMIVNILFAESDFGVFDEWAGLGSFDSFEESGEGEQRGSSSLEGTIGLGF